MEQSIIISNILNLRISYQNDTWSEIKGEITLKDVIATIQKEKFKEQIEILRMRLQEGDKDYYDHNKKKLPAVTFSGSFYKRRTLANLNNYNPIIIIDIDKLDIDTMKDVKNKLLFEKIILSFWKSPSNNGFKGIVPLKYNISKTDNIDFIHKCAFRKLSQYFLNTYEIELDKSGSDITRLCFLSSDKDLILKDKISFFDISEDDISETKESKEYLKQIIKFSNSRDALYNPKNKNNPKNRTLMSAIIRYLNIKKKSITFEYSDWSKVAMAISNTFTFDIGLKYFLKLSKLDTEKYNEIICTNFLSNCYETRKGEINFSTIIFLANQQGYRTKYQKNGVPKAEE